MGLCTTPEEREAEARQRADERLPAGRARAQQQAAEQAAFAQSPLGRARAAAARGDRCIVYQVAGDEVRVASCRYHD